MPFASVTSDSLQPIEFCLPGSSAHGIHQARILEWVAMPSSRRFSPTSDQICISGIAGEFFATKPPWKPIYLHNGTQLLVLYRIISEVLKNANTESSLDYIVVKYIH